MPACRRSHLPGPFGGGYAHDAVRGNRRARPWLQYAPVPCHLSPAIGRITTMRKHLVLFAALATAALTLLAAFPGAASAHEKRQVGAFTFVVGFLNEPAIVDQPNSIDLTITDANNQPVSGAEKTLKAQIIFGGETQEMTLSPRFNAPGKYNAYFIPTKTGTWKFHFTGSVDNQAVDELFTSGPGRFNDVASTSEFD